MASLDSIIEIGVTEALKEMLQKTQEELKAAREALSEERIRAIVREELEAHEKQRAHRLRNLGLPAHAETK